MTCAGKHSCWALPWGRDRAHRAQEGDSPTPTTGYAGPRPLPKAGLLEEILPTGQVFSRFLYGADTAAGRSDEKQKPATNPQQEAQVPSHGSRSPEGDGNGKSEGHFYFQKVLFPRRCFPKLHRHTEPLQPSPHGGRRKGCHLSKSHQ